MPVFEIEQYELHTMKFRVEAANEAEAIAKLFGGDGEAVENSLEFVEIAEDMGLPVARHQELAEELRSLGVVIGNEVIPSIRSVSQSD